MYEYIINSMFMNGKKAVYFKSTCDFQVSHCFPEHRIELICC